jgi:hypothetical protein
MEELLGRVLPARSKDHGRRGRHGLFDIGGAVVVLVLFDVFRLRSVSGAVPMQLCIGTALTLIPRREATQAGRRGSTRKCRCGHSRCGDFASEFRSYLTASVTLDRAAVSEFAESLDF